MNMYKDTKWKVLWRISDSNPEMQIFIWFTNVKEGVMHRIISFKILFESTNHTKSVGHLSNLETNNTKTTLSQSTSICNSNYDVWSTTRNPQCETGTRGPLQRAIVMTLLYSSTPYKQKMEIRGCMHDKCIEIITRGRGRAPKSDTVCLMYLLAYKCILRRYHYEFKIVNLCACHKPCF